ncbi:MAG: ribbon-helix-helix domain-containing protein [Leptospirillum sp.]
MSKTISVKLPDEDAEILEKISADRQENVSELVRNLIRDANKQAGNGEAGKEENIPASDPRFDEILTLLWRLIESKCDPNLSKDPDAETAKKIEEVGRIVAGFPGILFTQIHELREEIGQIPTSKGAEMIDVSGLKTSVGKISVALKDAETKAKNVGGYLDQGEEKMKDILGGMSWRMSLILLLVGAGFVGGGYALARYTMPDIPALKMEESALKESIRVLSLQDPKRLDMSTCGGNPCIRVQIGPPGSNTTGWGEGHDFYLIAPLKR